MPTAIPSTSKQTIRQWLQGPDRMVGTTTATGSTTTAVNSSWTSYPIDFFRGKYLLMTSGAASGQWRLITDFTSSSGTITVTQAFLAATGDASTFEITTIRPDLYGMAVNYAIGPANDFIHRPEIDYLLADAEQDRYGVPRGIQRPYRVDIEEFNSEKIDDKFDRGDSTTSAGGDWTATSGTWGISAERLYSVTDADGDLLTQDPDSVDPMIEARLWGTLNSATIYRSPVIIFRLIEDKDGNIPAAGSRDYLIVRLLSGAVTLRKLDQGTESELDTEAVTTADGTAYVVRVLAQGNLVRVWVDDVERISYRLLGGDRKYESGTRVGIRWDLAGAPGTAARVDYFRCHKVGSFANHHDWGFSEDARELNFGVIGKRNGLSTDYWLRIEGSAPLSQLASDTTFGTLASDTALALEIETTDPAWNLFLEYCWAELYRLAQNPAWNHNLETIPIYANLEQRALLNIQRIRPRLRMKTPRQGAMYPY